jgi:hypothetical protein
VDVKLVMTSFVSRLGHCTEHYNESECGTAWWGGPTGVGGRLQGE